MASASDYLESKLRDHVLRNIAYTSPATIYLAVYSVAPTDAGGGTEAVGGSYARKVLTFVAGGAAGEATTSAAVDFPNMPAGTWVHAGIFDALTVGNLLMHAALTAPKTTLAGETLSFAAGDIDAAFL
jgi:hypothetical protein